MSVESSRKRKKKAKRPPLIALLEMLLHPHVEIGERADVLLVRHNCHPFFGLFSLVFVLVFLLVLLADILEGTLFYEEFIPEPASTACEGAPCPTDLETQTRLVNSKVEFEKKNQLVSDSRSRLKNFGLFVLVMNLLALTTSARTKLNRKSGIAYRSLHCVIPVWITKATLVDFSRVDIVYGRESQIRTVPGYGLTQKRVTTRSKVCSCVLTGELNSMKVLDRLSEEKEVTTVAAAVSRFTGLPVNTSVDQSF